MTDIAALPSIPESAPNPMGFPTVKPRWLGPAATVAVVAAHVAVAVLLMVTAIEKVVPLDQVSMDLIPEGDMFESVEQQAMDETPPPEEVEQPDLAIPPPVVMAPEAVPLPAKKEVVEPKKRVVENKQVVQSQTKQEAQERHRLGMAGGRATTGGLSKAAYGALLAAAIRRHVPATSSLGEGTASCSFHVTSGGGMTGISCSGSTPGHAALLQRAIAAVHAPPPPGGAFFASQPVHFR
jgi:protein TonB